MGVHGLWELLAPVGRRVSVETLAGKKLAIDASIWMIQFMKAMRDEKGEMIRNAHILGFFRRICKLLYLRTKPVFVFDGGTPALKRRTVIARRRQRENAQAKIRKTAEKLLLNHLKTMRLKELAADLEKQRQENDRKGKRPIIEEQNNVQHTEKGSDAASISYNQEELDEMLAASLAVEENEGLGVDASTSGAGVLDDEVFGDGDEDEDDDDEEMILPEMHGKIDPAVLAALPPSMQLDLLVQMRERLMAENRQKYQKVKKAPARFSELQIEAYLKTVAFRREIDGVQKSAAGRGIGGIQTSRIASEANREFIFSSSFTGDKQALTSVGQERVGADQSQPPPVNLSTNVVTEVLSTKRSGGAAGPSVAEAGEAFHDDVETYLDERGRLRVSRIRALGIRMTRDLQRNLDLMKEIDQENANLDQENNYGSIATRNPVDVLENPSDRNQHREITDKNTDGISNKVDKIDEPAVVNETSIEITFEDSLDHEHVNDDDKLFARLVAGDTLMDFSVDNSASANQSSPSASDCEWEEGVVEDKSTAYLFEGGMTDEGEVEWEEGVIEDIQLKSSPCPEESHKPLTKGSLQEEADFQEAIRRSLEDTGGPRSMNDFDEGQVSERAREIVDEDADLVPVYEGKEGSHVEAATTTVSQPFGSMNILATNCSGAKSSAFIELNPDKSNLDFKLLNQDAGGYEALAGEVLVVSDALPEEKGLCMTGKKPIETLSEDGSGHAVNRLVGTCRGEVAHNSSSSAFISSFTDPLHDGLVDSGSADAQKNIFQEALDVDSGHTAELEKVTADHSVTDVGAAKELAKEKSYSNSIGKEEPTRNSSFMDDTEEREIMKDHLEKEMLFLDKAREELGSEQRKLERNAESVSSEMFAECQELLQMFGLPYIIAPMEAEAQCAFMELSNLVDGVVTDDSDAFLFGARSVYKNIFDDRKYVETYLMKDIEDELGLDREKLIHMALLLGSDYTEGISGIGIVNAIEVVNAFPGKDGLREFREWIESPDPTILGKLDVEAGDNSRRKGSKGSENIKSDSNDNTQQPDDVAKRIKQIFMDKHRNVSKNWHIPSSFPSDAVISAYDSPQVDKSTEPFSWGKPDLIVLRKLCWEKFAWNTSKADDLLLPVLKEYNKHETQLRLEAFYTFNERFAKIRSKRIKKAVKGIAGRKSSEWVDDTPRQQSGRGKKRKVKPSEAEADQSGVDSRTLDDAGTSNQNNDTTVKQLKGQQTEGKSSQGSLRQSTSVNSCLNTRKEGKHRGRGRGQQSGRGRRKKNSSADMDTNNNVSSSSESDTQMQFDKSEESHQVRRVSGRLRKNVNYTLSDEFDNGDKESESCLNDGATTKESSVDQAVLGVEEINGNQQLNEGSDVGTGGRPDKMDTGRTYDNPLDQGQLSKEDYLQFGGGFCLDEDEETEFDGNASNGTRETITEKSKVLDESDPSIITSRKTGLSDTELNMNDDENDSGNCFRAMPNLRRKKRKT